MEEKKQKKPMNPVWFLVIGIVILIVPAAVYLGFLIPQMKDEYIILMSSGGAIGGAGIFGTQMIPDKTRYGMLFKTASKSFTLLVVITLVQEFIKELIGLAAVVIVSYIIFLVMKGLWKDGKRARENKQLAKEVSRGVIEATK